MHILAVDDDPVILEVVAAVIDDMRDQKVTTVESAAEALALLEKLPKGTIDCFLLDIQMPDTDGIELCRLLRKHPEHRITPIVMLTAMVEKRYIDGAFAAGANDYVIKPFEVSELQHRILQAEQRAKLQRHQIANYEASRDSGEKPGLHEAIKIFDVDNLIDYGALENYLPLLSSQSLYGSVVVGFHIRQVADIYKLCSGLEFRGLIEDVAETISDSLRMSDFLMAYAGNGTFLCVVKENRLPALSDLVDQINIALHKLGMNVPTPQGLPVRVCTGGVVRLLGSKGSSLQSALTLASANAETASARAEREADDFWLLNRGEHT